MSNIIVTKMLNGISTEQLMSLQKILIILEKEEKIKKKERNNEEEI